MSLIDGMITTGRLTEFVDEIVGIHNEEEEERVLYEVWLHKVFDKGFDEFRESIGKENNTAAPTQEDIANTIRGSKDLLNSFVPHCGGVDRIGTVPAVGNNSG